MHTVRVMTETNKDGHLHLDVPVGLTSKKIELVMVIHEMPKKKARDYDFGDLVGQLRWVGDPVKMQRAIRNEW